MNRVRKATIFLLDLCLINLSISLAFMIRFDWNLPKEALDTLFYFMIWVTVFRLSLFLFFGLYQWSFRYASITEAVNVLRAVTIGSMLLVAVAFFSQCILIGRSILLIDYVFCLFLIGVSRFLPRVLIKIKQGYYVGLERVLIVGAGATGENVVREMINASKRIYQPICFVDDDPRKRKTRIHGIKVLGTTDEIEHIVKNYNIEQIIIAIPSATGRQIRDIISKSKKTEAKIKTVPGFHNILTGEVSVKHIRDVSPSDLLGREVIDINTKDLHSFIAGKKILVTGAAGTIGSELTRQIIKFSPAEIILYDYNENDIYFLELEIKPAYPHINIISIIGDIKDIGSLKSTFSKYRPHIVFHSAAHKHVPLMEDNPASAVKNNIIGTRNLIYAAEHYKVESFVMISTDKAVNPSSIMGASKRIAEMIIQAKSKVSRTKFMAVRFGNVIGSSGSVIPIFKRQIEKGGPVTVTHQDIKRYFMTAGEAAQLVMQAGAIGENGSIFVLDMGEQIKIMELARNMIILSGFEPDRDIEIKITGLRSGEKMYEETMFDKEHSKTTKYNRIYKINADDISVFALRKSIKELERLSGSMQNDKILEKISSMVPSYQPRK